MPSKLITDIFWSVIDQYIWEFEKCVQMEQRYFMIDDVSDDWLNEYHKECFVL